MTTAGYYRFPALHGATVVFVAEDDLWAVSVEGGVAHRLTAGSCEVSRPCFSSDGAWLAFSGKRDGPQEVYCMPSEGGPGQRLTFLGGACWVVGWSPDGQRILFSSSTQQAFERFYMLQSVPRSGGLPVLLPTGPALSISYGPSGGVVIGRHSLDPARWKRYRGGAAGDLWIDPTGNGHFQRLLRLPGDLSRPMWIGTRIYFLSDHEGVGNLYSCLPTGGDLRRHTDHTEFYVRHPATDGKRIVYHAGADLFLFDSEADTNRQIEIVFPGCGNQRRRKFIAAARFLEDYALHPQGHSVAVITRGKVFTLGNWEGAVTQHGERDGVRYRLASWLADGRRLVTVSDAGGEEALEVHDPEGLRAPVRLEGMDLGRISHFQVSPTHDQVVLCNHRFEVIVVDLTTRAFRQLDQSRYGIILGMAWSPDGRWVAYGLMETAQTSVLKIALVETGQTWPVTRPVLHDFEPSFDPDGKYLYFLSRRDFEPVADNLQLGIAFPYTVRPHLLTLRQDMPSPFSPQPPPPTGPDFPPEVGQPQTIAPMDIEFEGIADRVVVFPVPEARYEQLRALRGGVLFTTFPAVGPPRQPQLTDEPVANGTLHIFVFNRRVRETLAEEVTNFTLAADGRTLLYRSGSRLRVLSTAAPLAPERAKESPGHESGWIDLERVKVSLQPPAEWRQMISEIWRLQRDYFHASDMAGVDWQRVYDRYRPLLERIATRSECSDLIWEMQGELGTSHAYESGGDYRPILYHAQGSLGADFEYDEESGAYRIIGIVRGDPWDPKCDSPLNQPGVNIREGDLLLGIDGCPVSKGCPPPALLVSKAGAPVRLRVATGQVVRCVTVVALRGEMPARYRQWVERNRRWVHEQTQGRVGYVHLPDTDYSGYAAFHRYFLAEVEREGLIIDTRFNRGGHLSQLVLEKLARRHLGYLWPRWGQPCPYPACSVTGPLVCLTNECAGSDGDVFSHGFKLLQLGPLIGTRTWGGVIGGNRRRLVDGTITTQPEYARWFHDVGWGLENRGAEPDVEVEVTPQDYARDKDPQLERAVQEVLKLLTGHPSQRPEISPKPKLPLPQLPPRSGE